MSVKGYQITSNLEDIPFEVLKLYYESAQKRMADYHQEAINTTDRSYKLLGVYLSVITLMYGYLYTKWDEVEHLTALLFIAVGFTVATVFILLVISPRYYMPLGRSPKEMKLDVYIQYLKQEKYSDEDKLKYILRDELKVLQDAIEEQYKKNGRRTFLFACSLLSAVTGILSSAFFFFSLFQ